MRFRILLLIVCWFMLISTTLAQVVSEDFSDGNFSENPAWGGDVTEFIVNADEQLQLNFQPADLRPAYVATSFASTDLVDKEWRFELRMDFSPSASNKVVIYLASTTTDLLDFDSAGSTQEAYFLEIGENGSNDAVSLFYRNGGSASLIARGTDGQFAAAFAVGFRVRRDAAGQWDIATAPLGTESFLTTASGSHSSLGASENLGFICYFTSTRRQLFYFDNIYFGNYIEDVSAPEILTSQVMDNKSVQLVFSEKLEEASVVNVDNYSLTPGNLNPIGVSISSDTVLLEFSSAFSNGTNYSLAVKDIEDLSGNLMATDTITFFYYETEEAEPGDVIVSEFFPDPTPVFGLPEAEFVELFNASAKYITLENWKITDNTSSEYVLPEFLLAPGSYVILTSSAAKSAYEPFGEVLSPLGWPALNNGGDGISVKSAEGILIDGLAYTSDWYQDAEKEEGGYTLERINLKLACFDVDNWIGSIAGTGGTPGLINSVDDPDFSGSAPQISGFLIPQNDIIRISFNKQMDLESLSQANYSLTPQIAIAEININPASPTEVELLFESSFSNGEFYELKIDSVQDCNSNRSSDLILSFTFDNIPPQLTNLVFMSDSLILLQFDEPLQEVSAMETGHYHISSGVNILSATLFSEKEVHLALDRTLSKQTDYQLTINQLEDLFGNITNNEVLPFTFQTSAQPGFNELLITEIMAKPVADQPLPHVQYVEVFNPGNTLLSLAGLKFMDARDTAAINLNYIEAGEYVILCPRSAVTSLQEYGRVIGLSPWPNLNNAGDELQLITLKNEVVHQVFYTESWYKEDYKKEEGGWSLEMIDTANPCGDFSNWTASRAAKKGSPGRQNSVTESNQDLMGPQLKKAFAPSEKEVELYFNEPIDLTQVRINQFALSPSIDVSSLKLINNRTVRLYLQESLKTKTPYTIMVNNLTDCVGNLLSSENNSAVFAVVEEAEQNDIVLNEVLYDARSGGVDFIEFYNRSDKYINLRNWRVMGADKEVIVFPTDNVVLVPGQVLALTSNRETLISQYPTSSEAENIVETDLPTFNNIEGLVHIISANSALEEFFEYHDDLHLPFLRSTDGVSLERISPEAPIDKPDSWQSAASTAGYATPGKFNSQLTNENIGFGEVRANPQSFAHNAPGRNYTIINYTVEEVGNVASVKIFDSKGTVVKVLANNETLNSTGFFRWDGDDESGRKVRTGYYLVYFELFTATGTTRLIKERVAVGATF